MNRIRVRLLQDVHGVGARGRVLRVPADLAATLLSRSKAERVLAEPKLPKPAPLVAMRSPTVLAPPPPLATPRADKPKEKAKDKDDKPK